MIKINDQNHKVYVGIQEIAKVYIGSQQVYQIEIEEFTLTIVITGLPEVYELYVNGVLWPDNEMTYPSGTILTDFTPTVDGYTIAPPSIGEILMDEDKSVGFVAAPIAEDYIPVAEEWIDIPEITRVDNNLSAESPNRGRTNISILNGELGFARAIPNGAEMFFSYNSTDLEGFNDVAFGFGKNPVNHKIEAFSYKGGGGTNRSVETLPIEDDVYVTVQLSDTEIVFMHSESLIEWARFPFEQSGSLTMKCSIGGGGYLNDIGQKGSWL